MGKVIENLGEGGGGGGGDGGLFAGSTILLLAMFFRKFKTLRISNCG